MAPSAPTRRGAGVNQALTALPIPSPIPGILLISHTYGKAPEHPFSLCVCTEKRIPAKIT